ncbi:MAG: hypothetical protein QOH61_1788 [Chloroflexota bacterium]|jgi:hypothetical protein|nr:hypothetical protein [Chloroflexota bacterium]
MPDDLEAILGRVASGELSPEDAEPLIAAASAGGAGSPAEGSGPAAPHRWPVPPAFPRPPARPAPPIPPGAPAFELGADDATATPDRPQRIVRLQVLEGGKPVVNLRIPMSLAGLAGTVLPGISGEHADRLREAIRSGSVGRILEVQDEDGDGVIISTE